MLPRILNPKDKLNDVFLKIYKSRLTLANMETNISKDFLKSKYRKEMWVNAQRILRKLEKVIPIEQAYLRGSFTTNKKRPADVDFIILLKIKDKKTAKWSIDLVICPNNKYGKYVVKDATKWMKQKYGSKKAMFIKLK